ALTLASAVGRRLPAHATGLGKVLLADLSAKELDARLGGESLENYTSHTITDRAELDRVLAEARRDGHAGDEEEYTLGVRCVAVPVLDHTGRTVAGMSVSVPTIRFDEPRRSHVLAVLRVAGHDLSEALGYRRDGDSTPAGGSTPVGRSTLAGDGHPADARTIPAHNDPRGDR
ncbi:MAG: IclR family transcriptional regulator, partial [Micromonosporaceae bacterium]